jgi:hypothetical protein
MAAVIGLGTTAKYVQQTTSGAAGNGQLLKSASTTPRSYSRKHRSLHHGHVHATHIYAKKTISLQKHRIFIPNYT